MSAKLEDIVVFVDQLGRTVLAERSSDSKTVLEVKNPSVVHVTPNQQTGQISVQLIPYFFKEFAKGENTDATTWLFLKSNITMSKGLELDERLVSQYNNMYSVIQAPNAPEVMTAGGDANAPVVKLFDD